MVLLRDVVQVETHFGPFGGSVNLFFFCGREVVLISTQDRYMACAKHTIGLEMIFDAPNCTPR
jgi:hypothetical protein